MIVCALRHFVLAFSILLADVISAQNQPWIELSIPVTPALNLGANEALNTSFIISANYVINPKFTTGITFVYENISTSHEAAVILDSANVIYHQYLGTGDRVIHQHQARGIGLNAKYNILNNPNFRIYSALQLNFVKLTNSPGENNDRYIQYNEDGSIFQSYESIPLPYEGSTSPTFNLIMGCDFRLFSNAFLYFSCDYHDFLNSLNYDYSILMKKKTIDNSRGVITDVSYPKANNGSTEIILNIQFGLRLYLFEKKL